MSRAPRCRGRDASLAASSHAQFQNSPFRRAIQYPFNKHLIGMPNNLRRTPAALQRTHIARAPTCPYGSGKRTELLVE
ncbi:hypothetical protein PCAR4_1090108 [Paraburkholderia caribensis]|nr:hypothetical protein PCAR4_1090108 [Paraburkholderia caribensis]